ncbi:hypothetical protein [Desulfuromonas versatilis]|nr:hypothetical protein [Desulfuromonas versatilis]
MLPVESRFPDLTAIATDCRAVHLPRDIATEWAILLGYRANW